MSDWADDMVCRNCGRDLIEHHPRNLRCPNAKTIYVAKADYVDDTESTRTNVQIKDAKLSEKGDAK